MYDFEVNDAICAIIDQSSSKEKTVQAISYTAGLLKENEIHITDYRWQSLANHVAAMVERSLTGERLEGIEAGMFTEVSRKSLDIAKAIVDEVGSLPEDEMYLLSIHFETAHLE